MKINEKYKNEDWWLCENPRICKRVERYPRLDMGVAGGVDLSHLAARPQVTSHKPVGIWLARELSTPRIPQLEEESASREGNGETERKGEYTTWPCRTCDIIKALLARRVQLLQLPVGHNYFLPGFHSHRTLWPPPNCVWTICRVIAHWWTGLLSNLWPLDHDSTALPSIRQGRDSTVAGSAKQENSKYVVQNWKVVVTVMMKWKQTIYQSK